MFWKSKAQNLKELLLAYLNGSLTEKDRQAVQSWLATDPGGKAELEKWARIQNAILQQPSQDPKPAILQRIKAQARATAQAPNSMSDRGWLTTTYLSGLALALGIFIILWTLIKPGVVLAWSVQDGDLLSYKLYRAPLGSQNYELLAQVPANPSVEQYTYVDAFLLPGQAYDYLVQGIGRAGQMATSETVRGNGFDIFPAQISLLLSSVIISFILIFLVRLFPFRKSPGHGAPLTG